MHLKRITKLTCSNCKERLGVKHQFCPRCGAKISTVMKKQQEKRRIRVLPIDRDSLDMLKNCLNEYKLISNDSVCVFRLNRHRVWQIVRECARRAGIPDLVNPETGRMRGVSPHRLRDAFSVHAMKLDSSGDGLRLLQEHLGHVSFNTTAKYRKIAGDEQRKWYDGLWVKETNVCQ